MALCCLDPAWIFIHVPRTAGTSFRAAVGWSALDVFELGGAHTPLRDLERLAAAQGLADWYARAFRFCIARNPFPWVLSCWTWVKQQHVQDPRGWVQEVRALAPGEFAARFDEFRELSLAESGGRPEADRLLYQYEYADPDATIIRHEELPARWPELRRRLGLEDGLLDTAVLPRHNVLPRPDYRAEFTPAQRRAAERVFAVDLARLGYQWGDADGGLALTAPERHTRAALGR